MEASRSYHTVIHTSIAGELASAVALEQMRLFVPSPNANYFADPSALTTGQNSIPQTAESAARQLRTRSARNTLISPWRPLG